ncbi:C40 family peptidase [Tessaracoccus sp. MC1627]|uniref:C40 family peptidase n=1 Tax=Tessaracoccus sp. MC1627 TaxID=2760312 RepID=UPI0016020870|nr:C40 family peptidase [Tessaracoccus sp. MC1627]
MNRVRLALTGIVAAALVATMGVAAQADPAAVEKAREELARIQQESSAIDQELIEASERAQQAEAKLKTIAADLQTQEAKVSTLADEMGDVATLQMRHDSFSVTAQLLTSGSSDNFLSGLAAYQSELDRSNAGVQQLQLDQAKLTTLREDAAATEATVKKELATKTVLAEEFEAKEAEAQRVYDRLSEEERQRLAAIEAERQARAAAEQAAAEARAAEAATTSRSRETTASSAPKAETQTAPVTAASSSRVQGAINAALAKVGSAYVWGTSGPNTFDCSGLTSYAYRQVGITLSRSSRTQYSSEGRKVSLSEIQPGDLVFYYSPVSHVALYIGNGKIVHAANPRSGVNVTSLHSMPITGVRRVVG